MEQPYGRSERGPKAADIKERVDLLAAAKQYVPGLKQAGSDEWVGLCPLHEEGNPSFTVTPSKGLWHCFSCQNGGDVIAFVQAVRDCSFQEALVYLDEKVGSTPPPRQPAKYPSQGKKSVWLPIIPIPLNAPSPPERHYKKGSPSRRWIYRNEAGHPLFHVCRFDSPDGGKEVLPQTFCRNQETGQAAWRWQGVSPPRPLYNLDHLAANPDAWVIVIEGEKSADTVPVIFPDWLATTSPNGCGAADLADWSPLAGRHVVIWPDADDRGRKYGDRVAALLREVGAASVREIRSEWFHRLPDGSMRENLPEGWDAADAVAEGYSQEEGKLFLADPGNLVAPHQEHMAMMAIYDAGLEVAEEQRAKNQAYEEERRKFPFEVVEYVKGRRNGVYFLPPASGDEQPEPIWICSPLRIVARTRDGEQEAHGRVLEFTDADGHLHQWAMPMSLLAGDGTELRSILFFKGLELSSNRKARELLADYLQRSRPEKTARCVEKVGWHGGAFVLPDTAIGQTAEMLLFQTAAQRTPGFGVRGTLEEWQQGVAALCQGNSRLLFAVSMAFAAPLLYLVGEESGGFNLVGPSSGGKSTALKAATSVWGEQARKQAWRATSNGLEGLALSSNDTLLSLDELGQVDPREAGESAYLLANGTGKSRANRDGSIRRPHTWRTLFLSAGELGLSEHMRTAGKRVMAGQEIRLADIPADAGAGCGLFEELHGHGNGAELAGAISRATEQYHGTAARAFLEKLTDNLPAIPGEVEAFRQKFQEGTLPKGADGQVRRLGGRFALVAAAGELATAMGVTGWEPGQAEWAAMRCFEAWLSTRGGTGPQEERNALAQVRLFFEKHGEARFTPWDGYRSDDRVTINRAGFRRERADDGQTEYFVLPETFRVEVCEGMDQKLVAKALVARGVLIPGDGQHLSVKPRIPGMGPTRCYHLIPFRLEDTP